MWVRTLVKDKPVSKLTKFRSCGIPLGIGFNLRWSKVSSAQSWKWEAAGGVGEKVHYWMLWCEGALNLISSCTWTAWIITSCRGRLFLGRINPSYVTWSRSRYRGFSKTKHLCNRTQLESQDAGMHLKLVHMGLWFMQENGIRAIYFDAAYMVHTVACHSM